MVKHKKPRAVGKRTRESLDRSARGHTLAKAAEYRVFSELILRGQEVYQPIDDRGIDAILKNGLKVDIKVCSKTIHHQRQRQGNKTYEYVKEEYVFSAHLTKRDNELDFYIVWLPDRDEFYIIPANDSFRGKQQQIFPDNPNHKFTQYKDAWRLLE